MPSLFCCGGSGDVKTYSKLKFNVSYVVLLCGFFVPALQPKIWSIKQEGVRPLQLHQSFSNIIRCLICWLNKRKLDLKATREKKSSHCFL